SVLTSLFNLSLYQVLGVVGIVQEYRRFPVESGLYALKRVAVSERRGPLRNARQPPRVFTSSRKGGQRRRHGSALYNHSVRFYAIEDLILGRLLTTGLAPDKNVIGESKIRVEKIRPVLTDSLLDFTDPLDGGVQGADRLPADVAGKLVQRDSRSKDLVDIHWRVMASNTVAEGDGDGTGHGWRWRTHQSSLAHSVHLS
ncbi:hypothetical protein F5Y08DRAFT_350387, partial [Xylaria arbuscula]